ncbi:MAG TPA: hypothetical protein VFX85_10665 [Solirubrobacterales bacterium]|nr:hypothetical protein [Solirubrobacterales bacterium]
MIAFERGDERIRAILKGASKLGVRVMVPASTLAQAWRGGPRSAPVARLIDGCQVDSLNEERAKEVGVRLGLRDVGDVADAQVVCCALGRRAAVATSDPDDIAALLEPGERLTVFVV